MTRMLAAGGAVALCASAGLAQTAGAAEDGARRGFIEVPVSVSKMEQFRITTRGRVIDRPEPMGRDCLNVVTHTDAPFSGSGSFLVQAGFAENEIAAATFDIPASAFPIKIEQMEFVIGTQNALVQTITEWSVLIYDGNPATGQLVDVFSSDDVILPHLLAGPGTTATNVAVSVDPNDPEQIFVFNDSGQSRVTIGFRIDAHNQPGSNPCDIFGAPSPFFNAFPVTDTGPLNVPTLNYIRALNCGAGGCVPFGGWASFSQLVVGCRPSGDWVIRLSWSSVNCQPGVGACCNDGDCSVMFVDDCDLMGGVYQGDGTTCDTVSCPEPTGACCNPAGGCLAGLTADQCSAFGGSFAGAGTDCTDGNMNGTADACEVTPPCPADLTGSSDPNDPTYGEPDGDADGDDFFFYLDAFTSQTLATCDLTGSSDPNEPSYGQSDGDCDGDDFFFYLDLFTQGCG
ncbi:MAG: GC-type dockerin domain-anchored protein [Phycisphaerales bacterium JB037]